MNTQAPSFLNQSSSFLQVTRTCMKAWMSSNFGQIPTPTPELSALARLKNCCIMLKIKDKDKEALFNVAYYF